MKSLLKIFALVISLAFVLGCVSCKHGSSDDPQPEEKTGGTQSSLAALSTLKAIDGVPGVYTIEYDGDYKLDDAINSNLVTADDLLDYLADNVLNWTTDVETGAPIRINVQGAGCSSIVAKNGNPGVGGYIYGRNFDWTPDSALIIHTMPNDGYESVSTCYVQFVAGEENWAPSNDIRDDAIAIAGIYVPMDGMNEKGLYIANLQNDTEAQMPAAGDTTKKYVQTTVAIRYILDRCSTVDEAIEWLRTINMCPVYGDEIKYHDSGVPVYSDDYHFAIADNNGNYAVIEWVNGVLTVVNSPIVTNHHLSNPDPTPNPLIGISTHSRYKALEDALDNAVNGEMTTSDVTNALKAAQQEESVWSAVFEPSAKRITYYFRKANPFEGITNIPEDPKDSANFTKEEYQAYYAAAAVPIDYTKPVVIQF